MVNSSKNLLPTKRSYIYSKFLNLLMYDGKKNVARKIVDESLTKAALKLGNPTKDILQTAILNVSPDIEVKSRRMGSSVYQVPVPLDQSRKINLGIRFLITASRSRRENTMVDKLSLELVDAFNNKGVAIKKKDDLHKLGEQNKSFAHFNW